MIISVSRESLCNGDDEQKNSTLEYQENDMLSSFLRYKVAEYLPYTRELTIWVVFMNSKEDQLVPERENPGKKIAFIHKIENRCSKVEICGSDCLVSCFGANDMFCAIYR